MLYSEESESSPTRRRPVVDFFVPDKHFLSSALPYFAVPGVTTDFLAAEPAVEFVVRNQVADGDFRIIVFFWPAAVVAVVVVDVVEIRRFRAAPAVVVELTLASESLQLRTGALGNEGAVTIRGDRDVPVLRIETLDVVEAVDIFLDLAISN